VTLPLPSLSSEFVSPVLTTDTSVVGESPAPGDERSRQFEGVCHNICEIETESWEIFKDNLLNKKTIWHANLYKCGENSEQKLIFTESDEPVSQSLRHQIDAALDDLEEDKESCAPPPDTVPRPSGWDTGEGQSGVKPGSSEATPGLDVQDSDKIPVENAVDDTLYISEEVSFNTLSN